jgi:hypothetical protein
MTELVKSWNVVMALLYGSEGSRTWLKNDLQCLSLKSQISVVGAPPVSGRSAMTDEGCSE